MPSNNDEPDDAPSSALARKADELIRWITERAINGVPPLSNAEELADEYLEEDGYADADERVDALIKWECGKNFAAGFVTGLGGLVAMPVAVPAAIGASWVLQARMAAAIARIYGRDLNEDKVRTFVLLTLLGGEATEILKGVGIKVGNRLTLEVVKKIPGKVLTSINKQVGFRLLTKAGQTGVINLTKVVPIAGGFVGGTVDLLACQAVGRIAKEVFRPASSGEDAEFAANTERSQPAAGYRVYYSFAEGEFVVEAKDAIRVDIRTDYPDLLARLTASGDYLGIIDADDHALQMMYDADDDRYWIEIPVPEESGSYGCHMNLAQIADVIETLPTRFLPPFLPGAVFKRW